MRCLKWGNLNRCLNANISKITSDSALCPNISCFNLSPHVTENTISVILKMLFASALPLQSAQPASFTKTNTAQVLKGAKFFT